MRRFLIIGGGIAGTMAAEKLRMGDPSAQITILEQESYRVYNKVLLPNVLQDRIMPDSIFIRGSEWYQEQNIALFLHTEVVSLDRSKKEVKTAAGETFPYDILILAFGGRARTLKTNNPHVHTFRTYDDTVQLKKSLTDATLCAIIGGGFISMELLLSAHHYKIPTHLILRGSELWDGAIHPEGSRVLLDTSQTHNTTIHTNTEVAEVSSQDAKTVLCLSNNTTLTVDVVTVGIGIDSHPAWLQNSGLLGERGVKVNDMLQSDDPSIYACGDCAEFLTSTGYRYIGNWQNAVAMGNRVAKNILSAPDNNGNKDEQKPYKRLTNYQIGFHDWFISFLGDTDPRHVDRTEDKQDGDTFLRLFYQKDELIGLSGVGMRVPSPAITSQIKV